MTDYSRDDRRKRSGLLACSERDWRHHSANGVIHREKKRQWPDAGIARVTRGGACKHTNGDGDHSPYIVATFAFFLIFNGDEKTQHF